MNIIYSHISIKAWEKAPSTFPNFAPSKEITLQVSSYL